MNNTVLNFNKLILATGLSLALGVHSSMALEVSDIETNYDGAQVNSGNYNSSTNTFTNGSGSDIQIETSAKANKTFRLDWRSYNVSSGQNVNYDFNAGGQTVINRVTGGLRSYIGGGIYSSGVGASSSKVVLINPNGMVFQNGSIVDVNSMVVSKNDIGNLNSYYNAKNFNASKLNFVKSADMTWHPIEIENGAKITTASSFAAISSGMKIDGEIISGGNLQLVTADGVNFYFNKTDASAKLVTNKSKLMASTTKAHSYIGPNAVFKGKNIQILSKTSTAQDGAGLTIRGSFIAANDSVVDEDGNIYIYANNDKANTTINLAAAKIEADNQIQLKANTVKNVASWSGNYDKTTLSAKNVVIENDNFDQMDFPNTDFVSAEKAVFTSFDKKNDIGTDEIIKLVAINEQNDIGEFTVGDSRLKSRIETDYKVDLGSKDLMFNSKGNIDLKVLNSGTLGFKNTKKVTLTGYAKLGEVNTKYLYLISDNIDLENAQIETRSLNLQRETSTLDISSDLLGDIFSNQNEISKSIYIGNKSYTGNVGDSSTLIDFDNVTATIRTKGDVDLKLVNVKNLTVQNANNVQLDSPAGTLEIKGISARNNIDIHANSIDTTNKIAQIYSSKGSVTVKSATQDFIQDSEASGIQLKLREGRVSNFYTIKHKESESSDTSVTSDTSDTSDTSTEISGESNERTSSLLVRTITNELERIAKGTINLELLRPEMEIKDNTVPVILKNAGAAAQIEIGYHANKRNK